MVAAVAVVAVIAAEAAADAVREAAAPPRRRGAAVAVEVPGMRGVAVAAVARLATAVHQPREGLRPPSRAPLVFDDSSQGSEVFPASGDRDVSVQEQLAFERKGTSACAASLGDEAKSMVSELSADKRGQLEAYRHRIAVLCPDRTPRACATRQKA